MNELLIVVFRSGTAFFILLLMARLMGKTQISQLTFFDYVVGITIGSTAAALSIDISINTILAITGILVWSALAIGIDKLVLKSLPARKLIQGKPTIVIQKGKLMEQNMASVHYNVDELIAQLRNQKIFDITQVEEAIIETNGKLSILLKPEYESPNRKDLNINTEKIRHSPCILVVDGQISQNRLASLGLDQTWLEIELRKKGIHNFSEVIVAQLGTNGELYVDRRSDWE